MHSFASNFILHGNSNLACFFRHYVLQWTSSEAEQECIYYYQDRKVLNQLSSASSIDPVHLGVFELAVYNSISVLGAIAIIGLLLVWDTIVDTTNLKQNLYTTI